MSDRTANSVTANGRGGVTAHGASVTHNGASATYNGASATHNGASVTPNGASSVTASTSVMLVAGQGPGQRTAVVPKVLTARKRTKNGVLKAPTELWLV